MKKLIPALLIVVLLNGCDDFEIPDFVVDGISRLGEKLMTTAFANFIEKAGDAIMEYFDDSAKNSAKTFNDDDIQPLAGSDTLGQAKNDNDFQIDAKEKGASVKRTVTIRARDIVFHRADVNSPWELTTQSQSLISNRLYAGSIQFALQSRGLYSGKVDGKLGNLSKSAIEKFQQQQGLEANGDLTPETEKRLMADK